MRAPDAGSVVPQAQLGINAPMNRSVRFKKRIRKFRHGSEYKLGLFDKCDFCKRQPERGKDAELEVKSLS